VTDYLKGRAWELVAVLLRLKTAAALIAPKCRAIDACRI
jgi:hypothetical protein